MPKRRTPARSILPPPAEAPPDQAAVERAIASTLDRLLPKTARPAARRTGQTRIRDGEDA